jgi:hypothetical protein
MKDLKSWRCGSPEKRRVGSGTHLLLISSEDCNSSSLGLCFSKCGPWIRNFSITWKFARKAKFQSHPRPSASSLWGAGGEGGGTQPSMFNKLRSEDHCSKSLHVYLLEMKIYIRVENHWDSTTAWLQKHEKEELAGTGKCIQLPSIGELPCTPQMHLWEEDQEV